MNDKLTAEERAIIQLARPHEDPSAEVRDRVHGAVLARVGVAIAAGATVAAASATAKAAGVTSVYTGKTILSSLLIVAGCAAVGVGAGLAARPEVAPAEPAPAATATPPPAPAAPAPPAVTAASATAAPEDPPAPRVDASSAPAPAPSAAPEDSLASEAALLQAAQKRLRGGDPAGALALLDEHARRHPSGALQQEAAAARIFALCNSGRRDEARAAAQRFLQASPSSPLAERVRTACP